jgi:hypothetical protein
MFLFCQIFAETQIFNFNPETQFFGDKFTVRFSHAHLRPKKTFFTQVREHFTLLSDKNQ